MPLSAPLERPEGLTRGLDGNIYVCCMNGNVIRRVTPKGEVSLFADGTFSSPASITGDRAGNFYVANYDKKGFVTIITPDGKSRVLVPPEAGLVSPVGVVVTPDGALLVSWGGDSVARVDIATGKVLNPRWITGLSNPRQMAFDTSYRLYLADQLNNAVRRYDLLGTPIPLTLRGADLTKPFGLAFDSKGFLLRDPDRRLAGQENPHRRRLRGRLGFRRGHAERRRHRLHRMTDCDVLVVGAGPAGCATAIRTARGGLSTVLLDRPRAARSWAGESLPPGIGNLVRSVFGEGVLSENHHRPAIGTRSVWGSDALVETDFLTNPLGEGWLLDRARFDADAREAAAAAGVAIVEVRHLGPLSRGPSAWRLDIGDGTRLSARFLVDATGRSGALLRQLRCRPDRRRSAGRDPRHLSRRRRCLLRHHG